MPLTATPQVSVIIPAYKIAAYIADTLESVFRQTFTDFEVILINDGSPDTVEFEAAIAPYRDRIRLLETANIGAGAARNFGIERSRGELLAFLDGDDIWAPNYLESQLRFLASGGFDLVYCDALLFGGSPADGQLYSQAAPSVGVANFESLLSQACNVITSGTVVRAKNVKDAGMFEYENVRAHDFVLWLRIARAGGKIGYQREVLLKYRIRRDGLSGNAEQQVRREFDVYHRILRLFDLSAAQQQIVQRHLSRLEVEMHIESGKAKLLARDYRGARAAFAKGYALRSSLKLSAVNVMLAVAPGLVRRLYLLMRKEEIAFSSTRTP